MLGCGTGSVRRGASADPRVVVRPPSRRPRRGPGVSAAGVAGQHRRVHAGDDLGQLVGPVLQEEVPASSSTTSAMVSVRKCHSAVPLRVEVGRRVLGRRPPRRSGARSRSAPGRNSPVKYSSATRGVAPHVADDPVGLLRVELADVDAHATAASSRRPGCCGAAPAGDRGSGRERGPSGGRTGTSRRCRRRPAPGRPPPAGGPPRRRSRCRRRSARTGRAGPSIRSRISSATPAASSSNGSAVLGQADVVAGDGDRVQRVPGRQRVGQRLVDHGAAAAVRDADVAEHPPAGRDRLVSSCSSRRGPRRVGVAGR